MALAFLPLLSGCGVVYFVGMPLVYDTVRSDSITEFADERYFDGPDEEDTKTRLDLFIPDGEDWPVVVFIHGGGWNGGDKDLRVGRKDVYRNIGRYFASHGIGAAVINYRLLPGVHWTTQLRDVSRAIMYTKERTDAAGGDADRLFLAGHSAGAQLAARVALDPVFLESVGGDRDLICGVVAVSGAGYDMQDQETYALGAEFSYLEYRFGSVDRSETWPEAASVVQFIDDNAPPFLIAYGGSEHAGLQRQSILMAERLENAGASVDTIVEPRYTHPRMVLAMSRDDKETSRRAVEFIESTSCGTALQTQR